MDFLHPLIKDSLLVSTLIFNSENMKTTIKYIYIFILTIGLSGCSNNIINKAPLDEISPENLLLTDGGFRSALDGVYAIMKQDFLGYNFCIYSIPEAINDDLKSGDPYSFTFEGSHEDIFPLTYNATMFQFEGFWKQSYAAINNVNTIIKGARVSDLANKDAYLAEALGLRALLHYNLYRFFSPAFNLNPDGLGIPYRLEDDALLEVKPRSTTKEIIELTLHDLLEAVPLAKNEVNSYRLSKTGIQALLARVYHETNQFDKAIPYAEQALADQRYALGTTANDLKNEWEQDESDEIIFRLRFEESDGGENAAMLSVEVYFSFPYYVSDDLINLYDQNNDTRFDAYFALEPMGSGEYYPKKHAGLRTADYDNYVSGATDIKLIRVPELYLILAESYDKTGNSALALTNLNILRNARGLGDYFGANLSDEILDGRRRELAFEGFRFTDLKRLGSGFTRDDGSSMAPNDDRYALPIPELEIERSGLTQNKGY